MDNVTLVLTTTLILVTKAVQEIRLTEDRNICTMQWETDEKIGHVSARMLLGPSLINYNRRCNYQPPKHWISQRSDDESNVGNNNE